MACFFRPGTVPQLQPDHQADAGDGEEQREVVVVRHGSDRRQVAVGDGLERIRDGNRLGTEDHQVETAEQEHAGKGDDERRYADVGHPESLPHPHEDADHDAEQDGHPPGEVPFLHRQCERRSDERTDRAHRQVDVAGDDDHHHADGEDQDVAVLDQQKGDVAGLDEQTVGQPGEQDHQQQQGDHHAVLAQVAGVLQAASLRSGLNRCNHRRFGHGQSAFR